MIHTLTATGDIVIVMGKLCAHSDDKENINKCHGNKMKKSIQDYVRDKYM